MEQQQLLTWSRPAALPSPAVWGRHEHAGTRYRIQEATPDLHDAILAFYRAEYYHDEPASSNVRLAEDEVSMAEFCALDAVALAQGASLVALEEHQDGGQEVVVGAMIIPVLSKEDPELPEFAGRGTNIMLGLADTLRGRCADGDPLTRADRAVPRYACDLGLWVRRSRRGRSLGLAILAAIPAMLRAYGLHHFSTPFTGARSQALAVKAGLKEMSRVKYAELLDPEGRPAFVDMPETEVVLYGIDV